MKAKAKPTSFESIQKYTVRAADSENWNVIQLPVEAYDPKQALDIFVRNEKVILKACHLPLIYEVYTKDKIRVYKTKANLAEQKL